jgi:hypothetical protein
LQRLIRTLGAWMSSSASWQKFLVGLRAYQWAWTAGRACDTERISQARFEEDVQYCLFEILEEREDLDLYFMELDQREE